MGGKKSAGKKKRLEKGEKKNSVDIAVQQSFGNGEYSPSREGEAVPASTFHCPLLSSARLFAGVVRV